MKTIALLGTTFGFAFAAGLNLYATVIVIGVAVRFGWVVLPGPLAGLATLSHPVVLGVAAVMYLVEFIADKVPAVDHAWDAVHTVVRPLGAAWIAWRTIVGAGLPEPIDVAVLLVAGGVALSAHVGKAGTRLATGAVGGHALGVGVALSLLEDAVAFVLAPLALLKPILVLGVVILALAALGLVIPRGIRALKRRSRAA